ncbi:transketolase [Xanthomonas campestris pv. campestris]|uniref:Transketolase n=3 Tax=Xanthomonas campestris pv. campestris TaxID=340 RepID=Q8P5W5_XANCP|nr:transketolase [Xanthomonas campestris]AAM42490.1 transketolase 1 [Xanthomonas campestris pv. campestris str. ATCC 33913]AAY48003.1 transketolase 1 [Xanthomonas campestris pv. campestris str. 8004]AKS19279.1 transketolase [Xanthomonas campestris pv. campestris]ALE69804.1 transketolase [Xanthomonas campestris pv. campestris]MBD8248971.1 transketolase [Xanthomonas campestris]
MTQPTRRQLANAIRFLAADAVEAAKSGHPGMPMGMADIAEVLWNDFFRHNPNNPQWFNRDRFVLSNGHGSMLQYALLHLSGYDLPIEQLKQFRQLHSKTAGHPERSETPGVETTTGPLGQGFANAVGFALAEKLLAQRYNRPELEIVDHRTWVFMGDGCMMEGISHEAASLAGTWGLGKLVAFWDNNQISIDGNTAGWFSDNTPARFEAYGWHVIRDVDGHDADKIKAAIEAALENSDKPTLICCRTKIGFGAPTKSGKESSHGAPLGKEELEGARKALEWPYGPFEIPEEIYAGWRAGGTGTLRQAEWEQLFDKYAKQYGEQADELTRRSRGELPADFIVQADAYIAKAQEDGQTIASRKASQLAIEAFAPLLPELVGGSADLAHSNLTLWKASKSVATDDPNANYVYYGVREFGMTAIANGLALHGGFIPFDATFLVFSDYARNGVRMSALNPAHAIHVYTHDSIGLGEDGPTHQPVEHLASLRYIPNNDVWRPGDAVESAVSWKAAITRKDGPSCLVFSRQNLQHQPRSAEQIKLIERGGYVLADAEGGTPDVILIGTGSEVGLAVEAKKTLDAAGLKTRVVSMPSTDVFDRQDAAYREQVLPNAVRKRVAVEAGVTGFWRKYVGLDGDVVGIDTFGASAPADQLYAYFKITAEHVVEAAKAL